MELETNMVFPLGLRVFVVPDDDNSCDHWVTAFSAAEAAKLAGVADHSTVRQVTGPEVKMKIPGHPKGYSVDRAHAEASSPRVHATIPRRLDG